MYQSMQSASGCRDDQVSSWYILVYNVAAYALTLMCLTCSVASKTSIRKHAIDAYAMLDLVDGNTTAPGSVLPEPSPHPYS
jgi:hypothetical protein